MDGMNERMNGWMAGWPDGRMARWLDGRMAGWPDGRMARWPDGWMAGWPGGWMAGWPDGCLENYYPFFCAPAARTNSPVFLHFSPLGTPAGRIFLHFPFIYRRRTFFHFHLFVGGAPVERHFFRSCLDVWMAGWPEFH